MQGASQTDNPRQRSKRSRITSSVQECRLSNNKQEGMNCFKHSKVVLKYNSFYAGRRRRLDGAETDARADEKYVRIVGSRRILAQAEV
jgi:hypothetical protein